MTPDRYHQLELLAIAENQPVSTEGVEQQESQGVSAEQPIEASASNDIRLPALDAVDSSESRIGSRLRAEREKRGWSCEEVGSRLKLQARLIRLIEQDDYSDISHAVYLRGYLTSYARLLGLPLVLAERAVAEVSQQPAPLVSTGRVSRSRYLLDRYSVSATYLILTGLVIGPAVWLATHGGLEQNLARTVMLDGPVATLEVASPGVTGAQPKGVGADASGVGAVNGPDRDAALQAPSTSADDEASPIVASMAPFATSAVPAPASAATEDAPVSAAAHSLTLKLAQPSWIEITSADGEKLEYGLLEAGIERTYSTDQPVSVRIGNAGGAEITADGERVELAPYQRANVAHLRVFAEGKLASRIDS
ncbi:cytoskeleton protein RodZ [Dokdonella immobilis]|uniref:Cytoskeleton protein RodZ n=1 Tax=Dokdonella immobilis TaxID=578942 RepID=A0A1I4V2P1_9GAMM|nr:cytoskeleton protein RodZ [Dokdonella immobilis]